MGAELMVQQAFNRLHKYCRRIEFKGWDLFDGLNSKLFRPSPFYRSKFLRLAWIQFFKHSPVNFRKITFVPKDYNPKGLALFATGFLVLGRIKEAEALLGLLRSMTCSGYEGNSWGYNFDWESRAFYVPQGVPNLVTTVFVANSFLEYFDKTGDAEALNIVHGACEFILKHLILFEDKDSLCFGYIPGEKARVHNASMMGAALLGRVFAYRKEEEFLEKSRKAMAYAIKALRRDYSWPYGERHHHQFVDNFHTGFNLVALHDWMESTGDYRWQEQLLGAYHYFLETFWLEDGCPKYYNNSLYPIDVHCSAQGIVTCLKLQKLDERSLPLAEKIAKWAIENMQDKKGFFYYQKRKLYTNKIPYIRWSQAWMFYALSYLISHHSKEKLIAPADRF
jgi:hypothetical protein